MHRPPPRRINRAASPGPAAVGGASGGGLALLVANVQALQAAFGPGVTSKLLAREPFLARRQAATLEGNMKAIG